MKNLSTLLMCMTLTMSFAQKKKNQDIKAIKAMTGCYDVRFNFAETFSPNKDYKFHDNYASGGLEYVFAIEDSKDKIVLQHLLIVSDSMIIKHWRQDWLYENTDLYEFDKENTWSYVKKHSDDVKGQWTQKVFQVDDSPRYEGLGSWVHVDGKHFWENTTSAPLPRREFSKRSDYNVMIRRNRHEIVDEGWVHVQDNDKVVRGNTDMLLAQEKGINTYVRTDDSKCQPAVDWWTDKHAYWDDVRKVWDELFAQNNTIKIKKKVDDKVLWMKLFALEGEMLKDNYSSQLATKKIKETINTYLEGNGTLAMK